MMRSLLFLSALTLSSVAFADDVAPDDDDEMDDLDEEQGLHEDDYDLDEPDADETCLAEDPNDCFWQVGNDTFSTQNHQLVDDDALIAPRNVYTRVYTPDSLTEPAPIIVLTHGGNMGRTNAATALPNWARSLVMDGYVVVAVAHPGRTPGQAQALCDELNLPQPFCGSTLAWDRVGDLDRVLDWIVDDEDGVFAGTGDTETIGMLGFSGGAGGVLISAGMERQFGDYIVGGEADPRVKSTVALSPPSNISLARGGFFSYDNLDRHVLVASSDADNVSPLEAPGARKDAHYEGPDFQRYLLDIDDPGAVHGLFGLGFQSCAQISGRDRCGQMGMWLRTSVSAFFAQNLREDEGADHWLSTDSITVATQGDMLIDKRHSSGGNGN